ncbi:MAG: beta-1,6-N-acetylglucosaminyltransferase [Acidobacteriota bacterium]
MKLAYFILVHHKPAQLRRLMRAIWRPQHVYVIHVDRRASAECRRAARDLSRAANVALLPPSRCYWGGWSLVRTELRAMRRLMAMGEWSYYVNLSGQDFPLRTQEEIAAELERLPRRDWLEFERALDPGRATELARREQVLAVELPWREKPRLIYWAPPWRAPLLKGATRYLGSQWKVLTREACEFLTVPRNTRRFRAAYWATDVPDESFFQTVLLNSTRRAHVAGRNWHFVDWFSGPAYPRVLDMSDLPRLEASDAFFARKFDDSVDDAVIAALEERLRLRDEAEERNIA